MVLDTNDACGTNYRLETYQLIDHRDSLFGVLGYVFYCGKIRNGLNRVLRLKGGDPYIFGRGGEELLYLQQRGIPVRCIPGITAASGISAELGIPLTHRGVATTVRFLTGHSRAGGEDDLDNTISESVDPMATLVVYMGLNTLPSLAKQLVSNGLSEATPAVAVSIYSQHGFSLH